MNILIIIIIISLLLNIILFYKAFGTKQGINYIKDVLCDILKSNFNRRINAGYKYEALEKMSTQINSLMDRFQSTIEEKEKLEMSHKQLIANISHDIRTPLTSLLGFVEVLQKSSLNENEKKEYLEIIHSKGEALYKMIEEFFELSRLEACDTDIKLEKVDLTEIVADTAASLYEDFVINNITPEIKLPEKSLYVYGHKESIERILHNLLSNALKYGKDGGKIGICVHEDEKHALVDVWDNGKGISENDMPFIFNRMYTGEASRNGKLHGTGLGLAIAKQLAKKQNGEITALSIPDEKTVFSFWLNKA